jgi:RNA polymerase sigma factor (sigma-70 family)
VTPSADASDAARAASAPRRTSDAVALRTADQAQAMVVATVQAHANDLLRVARRYSMCADDAHEAYQRALEIYVRHARRLEAESAHRWLFTVLKHEALAVRRQRSQLVGADEAQLDRLEARTSESPEDRALAGDDIARAATALGRLKPDEVRAIWLKASGLSYAEIMEETGFSYTKVNRCLAEGRASLSRHVTALESGAECERFLPMLSRLLDGEASRKELRPLRVHLRTCSGCRGELRALHERGEAIRVLLPAGVLAGAVGGGADVPGLLTRLYEAVATGVQERAAMSAVKVQAAVEAASTGKVAAVAASAAAMAGSGVVVAADLPDRGPSDRPPEQRGAAPATTPASGPAALAPATPASAAPASAPGPSPPASRAAGPAGTSRPPAAPAPRRRPRERADPARQEFAPPGPAVPAEAEPEVQVPREFEAPATAAAAGGDAGTVSSPEPASAPSAPAGSAGGGEFAP